MSARVITARLLRQHEACSEEVALFRKTFPKGTAITLRSCLKAAKAGLSLDWFAAEFLAGDAWAEYERQQAPLLAEYERQRAPLLVAAWKKQERAK